MENTATELKPLSLRAAFIFVFIDLMSVLVCVLFFKRKSSGERWGGWHSDLTNNYFKPNNIHFSHLNTYFVELDQFRVCKGCMSRKPSRAS